MFCEVIHCSRNRSWNSVWLIMPLPLRAVVTLGRSMRDDALHTVLAAGVLVVPCPVVVRVVRVRGDDDSDGVLRVRGPDVEHDVVRNAVRRPKLRRVDAGLPACGDGHGEVGAPAATRAAVRARQLLETAGDGSRSYHCDGTGCGRRHSYDRRGVVRERRRHVDADAAALGRGQRGGISLERRAVLDREPGADLDAVAAARPGRA